MWLDDCRIPFVDTTDRNSIDRSDRNVMMGWKTDGYVNGEGENTLPPDQATGSPLGRFTPNLLVCDDMLNDGVITKQSKRTYKPTENMGSLFGNSPQAHGVGIGDSGSSSRYYDLDLWFDKMLERL
jgi:hypothetical protein